MPSIQQAVEIIAHRTGRPVARCRTVARRLIEVGILPASVGAHIPNASLSNIVDILLPLLAGAKIKDVAETVKRYRALIPYGIDTTAMPEKIRSPRENVADLLNNMLLTLAEGQKGDIAVVTKSRVEVVASWPEVRLYVNSADPTGYPFAEAGTLTSHWQSGKIRTATSIPGTTLAAIVADFKAAH